MGGWGQVILNRPEKYLETVTGIREFAHKPEFAGSIVKRKIEKLISSHPH